MNNIDNNEPDLIHEDFTNLLKVKLIDIPNANNIEVNQSNFVAVLRPKMYILEAAITSSNSLIEPLLKWLVNAQRPLTDKESLDYQNLLNLKAS